MKALLVIMTGIGFTLGVVLGLLLHLPTDSLPAEHSQLLAGNARLKRSVKMLDIQVDIPSNPSSVLGDSNSVYDVIAHSHLSSNVKDGRKLKARARSNPVMNASARAANKAHVDVSEMDGQRSTQRIKEKVFDGEPVSKQARGGDRWNEASRDTLSGSSNSSSREGDGVKVTGRQPSASGRPTPSPEDAMYLQSLVRGVVWTDTVEQSCPRAFTSAETDSWRRKADSTDVVKMEEGCGRMQNRLLTFRDASKACARYRLNTDQIQGEIFSYYLAKLLNISNLPPTSLALVNSVDRKWRTVHLDLSLAQWADSKLVVLTQYLQGLQAAHIPKEFREERRKLHPILDHLGTKSRTELCELVQWSDLIVFDYLTANLDRVINNMFNRQWNDQIMESPAHNLEKFKDGKLVFLDNESGLFHGFRLIDKYESLHRALLDSLCVFRSSTASAIKRLAVSGSVGPELRALFQQNEPLYRHVANLPQKNLKTLQRRIEQVYEQISKCERMFNS